jgi:hypothetical protein
VVTGEIGSYDRFTDERTEASITELKMRGTVFIVNRLDKAATIIQWRKNGTFNNGTGPAKSPPPKQ